MQILSGSAMCAMLSSRQVLFWDDGRRALPLLGCDGDEDSAEETIIVD